MLNESRKRADTCRLHRLNFRPFEQSCVEIKNIDMYKIMAQIPFDCAELLPAMASSLGDIVAEDIKVSEVGLLSDDTSLLAPIYNGRRIVLDLTPGEDDWLEVSEVNSAPTEHHTGEKTQALHVAVRLSEADAAKLDAIDKTLRKEMGYSVISSGRAWYGMHRGGGKVLLNLIVANSVALTSLRFLQDGILKKGAGQAFLDECLGGAGLKDFYCKVKVELECIQETGDTISVLLTTHSVIFAPVPKRTVVDFTDEEEKAAIRAAKRLKYRF